MITAVAALAQISYDSLIDPQKSIGLANKHKSCIAQIDSLIVI